MEDPMNMQGWDWATDEPWEVGPARSGTGSYAMMWSLDKTLQVNLLKPFKQSERWLDITFLSDFKPGLSKRKESGEMSFWSKELPLEWVADFELCPDPLGPFVLFPRTLSAASVFLSF